MLVRMRTTDDTDALRGQVTWKRHVDGLYENRSDERPTLYWFVVKLDGERRGKGKEVDPMDKQLATERDMTWTNRRKNGPTELGLARWMDSKGPWSERCLPLLRCQDSRVTGAIPKGRGLQR